MRTALNDYETTAVEKYHDAQNSSRGNRTNMVDAGASLEFLVKGFYYSRFREKPEGKTLHSLITLFKSNEIVKDPYVINQMNFIRTNYNIAKRETAIVADHVVVEAQRNLTLVFMEFQKFGNVDYGLGSRMNPKPQKGRQDIIQSLIDENLITREAGAKLKDKKRFKDYKAEEKKPKGGDELTMACCLIDKSHSMLTIKDAVIKSHADMLNALRGSAKCKRESLFFSQTLFDTELTYLNGVMSKLSQDGKDKIVVLDDSNYKPSGYTALHDAIFETLIHLLFESRTYAEKSNKMAKVVLGVITDGTDWGGGGYNTGSTNHTPDDVKGVVMKMKRDRVLSRSLLIGLGSAGLQNSQLKAMQEQYGFDECLFVDSADSAAIRRAWDMYSQLAVNL